MIWLWIIGIILALLFLLLMTRGGINIAFHNDTLFLNARIGVFSLKILPRAPGGKKEPAAKKEKREPIIIPKFSCHIFRHTFASRFCENETNIKVIQEVMGHADVSTTMNIYAEVNNEVTRTAIENLAKNMDVF